MWETILLTKDTYFARRIAPDYSVMRLHLVQSGDKLVILFYKNDELLSTRVRYDTTFLTDVTTCIIMAQDLVEHYFQETYDE